MKGKTTVMNILLISNMYPSDRFPSYGVFVRNTENILVNNHMKIDKIVLQKKTKKWSKLVGYFFHYANILNTGLTRKYDYIYVHYASHNALPLLLLKKFKPNVKIVTNVHGSDVVPEVPSQEKYQPRVKKLIQQSTKVITPSPYYKKLVGEKYNVHSNVYIFPSGGVDPSIFHAYEDKSHAFKELNLDPAQKYLGCVSRIDAGKGWEYYLEAIALLERNQPTDYKYIYVGSGKDEDKFHQLVSELKLENKLIHFPLLPQSSLAYVYNVIDAFVFPTVRKGESLGLVGLEAMACNVPVIGSRIGGLEDYIKDRINGLFFEPGNSQELAKAMQDFINLSPEEHRTMANNALATADLYKLENISSKLPEIFMS